MSVLSGAGAPPVCLDPQPVSRPAPAPTATVTPVFFTDRPGAGLASGSPALEHGAELLVHSQTQTPVSIGIFGGPGAGKTQAQEQLVSHAEALATAASKAGGGSPFVSRLAVVRLGAAEAGEDIASELAAALNGALSEPASGSGFAAFALLAAQSSVDPHTAAREANRRLDETRRQLDGERRALDEADARRARLADVLLYEAAGSRVDTYARANRSALEPRLRSFGFTGDPVASYKDLVRDVAARPGAAGRLTVFWRSLWGFGGQARLIVWAIFLLILAWAAGLAGDTRDQWAPWLANLSEQTATIANWLGAHMTWFATLRQVAIGIALVCLLVNLWRAVRFTLPLLRGARLLESDMATRRRDLDTQIAHQTRRVDGLAAEAEAHARHVADAETRVGNRAAPGGTAKLEATVGGFGGVEPGGPVRAYLDALVAGMARRDRVAVAPERIVVVVDGLEGLPAAAAARYVETVHRLVARPGFALVLCADPAHLAGGWSSASDAAQRLRRLVQIPLSPSLAGGDAGLSEYARTLLGGSNVAIASPPPDGRHSVLDAPLADIEAAMLAALAPIAADSPRGVKRFVNLYKLARARGGDPYALALMLALDCGGAPGELNAMGAAMDADDPAREITVNPGEARLANALAAVNGARGKPLTIAEAQVAWNVARDYRTPF